MLDKYFYGEVNRISPEAPVPIVKIEKERNVLGGAANVAANLACLGCNVSIVGVTGQDENNTILNSILNKQKISCEGLITNAERTTITKVRILGGRQQMLRVDFEDAKELSYAEALSLQKFLESLFLKGIDGICISDYAKGLCSTKFCQWVIQKAESLKIPVLVDPKGNNWDKYVGCTFITPNLKELSEVIGEKVLNSDYSIEKAANRVRDKYRIKNVIVTRSEKGMSLANEQVVLHVPAVAREVFDVSGAGDTAAATLLASVAAGISLKKAIFLANRAAGIVVGKVGTYPIHSEELLNDIKYLEVD